MNKALIRVGTKPVISHIIDAYPWGTEFVITLGYKGDQIREFIDVAYPGLKVAFVEVEQWEGQQSSLGRSMLAAREHLQRPFIFHASDSIAPIDPTIIDLQANWILTADCKDPGSYRTLRQNQDRLSLIQEKGSLGETLAHIGIVRIHAWENFWGHMERLLEMPNVEPGFSDAHGINAMMHEDRAQVSVIYVTPWHDTGNAETLAKTRAALSEPGFVNLEKTDEAVYILGDQVVKFFAKDGMVEPRVTRGFALEGAVPEILRSSPHFFSYRKAPGELGRDALYPNLMLKFLDWCESNLWGNQGPLNSQIGLKFYYEKSVHRINEMGMEDCVDVINGVAVPKIEEMFDKVDWKWLAEGVAVRRFHGDLHPSNLLVHGDEFSLIDWRDSFGGDLSEGDVYYDLAKILHGLIVSHDIVDENGFRVEWKELEPGVRQVSYDIKRHQRLVECEQALVMFCFVNSYSIEKVRLLTALIYLNIATLHHYPYSEFLYFLGKDMLYRSLS